MMGLHPLFRGGKRREKRSGWEGVRLRPSRTWWSTSDPGDPDFTLAFSLEPGTRVTVQTVLPLRFLQRVVGKPLDVTLARSRSGTGWTLTVVLGLTAVHDLAGRRFDRWLKELVVVRACGPLGSHADREGSRVGRCRTGRVLVVPRA